MQLYMGKTLNYIQPGFIAEIYGPSLRTIFTENLVLPLRAGAFPARNRVPPTKMTKATLNTSPRFTWL